MKVGDTPSLSHLKLHFYHFQAFLCLSAVLAAASADVGFHAHPHVAHHAVAHAPVLHTPVSAAVAPVNYGANKPVNGYGHGQISHQSVSKPYQGEHRSTTQSKAFGAHAAVVADGKSPPDPGSQPILSMFLFSAPNRIHGAAAAHAPVAVIG